MPILPSNLPRPHLSHSISPWWHPAAASSLSSQSQCGTQMPARWRSSPAQIWWLPERNTAKKHRQYYQHCLVTQNSIRLCTQRHAYYSLQQSSHLFYYEIMKKWLPATWSTMTLVFFHKNPGYRVACWPNEVCILSTTTKNNTIFNTHRTNRKASLHPAILSVCTTMKL